jgi:serine/threonine protein kinase
MDNYTIVRKLGKGGHGEVYECTDRYDKPLAMKKVKFDKHRYILETSIMSTYIHPFLASSENTFIENNYLIIIQKLAKTDLSDITKENPMKLNHVKIFIRMIVEALVFLHKRKIVHGDVKAKNILLYENNTVKLSDFGLSTVMVEDLCYNVISTPTPKPPECYNNQGWSYPADIWSLGCTIYELVYGRHLFNPQQPDYKNETSSFDKKSMIWFSISDWLGKNEGMNVSTTLNDKELDLKKIPFKRVSHPNLYFRKEYKEVNDLIMRLLKYNPSERPTAEDVLTHPFLNVKIPVVRHYKIVKHKKYKLTVGDIEAIDGYYKKGRAEGEGKVEGEEGKKDSAQKKVALKLLSVCYHVGDDIEKPQLYKACVYLSYLLTRKNAPKSVVCSPNKILLYLDFRIHEIIV